MSMFLHRFSWDAHGTVLAEYSDIIILQEASIKIEK